jgi:uncharacterized protein (DUF1330 family)
MTAYALFDNIEVIDPAALQQYADEVHPTVRAFGGRYLAVGGEVRDVEGEPGLHFPVLLAFPDLDAARSWYDSETYAPLKRLRQRAARSTAVFFESAPSPLLEETDRPAATGDDHPDAARGVHRDC